MRHLATASRAVHALRPADKHIFGTSSPSLSPLLSSRPQLCRNCCCQAEEEVKTELERIVRRKYDEIQSQIDELGLDWLEEKLQDSVDQHAQLPEARQFNFGRLLTEALPEACISSPRLHVFLFNVSVALSCTTGPVLKHHKSMPALC